MEALTLPPVPARSNKRMQYESIIYPPSKRFSSSSSACKDSPNSSSTELPSSPVSSPPLPDKYTKSRAVGQSHRDNEKYHMESLCKEVQTLRDDNVLLFALFCAQSKVLNNHAFSLHSPAMPWDRCEDQDVVNEVQARDMRLYKMSKPAQDALGQTYISASLAMVMLEFILFRRNIVAVSTDFGCRKRRRGSFRASPTEQQAESACAFALKTFRNEAATLGLGSQEARRRYVDAKFGALALMLRVWSETERMSNPPPFEPVEQHKHRPGSPTSLDCNFSDFGYLKRRGEGAKRCSRCNVIKVTGSGHGRSKCADGYSISSPVPFPAAPPIEQDDA